VGGQSRRKVKDSFFSDQASFSEFFGRVPQGGAWRPESSRWGNPPKNLAGFLQGKKLTPAE
jgi:hypothetical protein